MIDDMKKILLLALPLVVMSLASCKKENIDSQQGFSIWQLWDYEYASDEWQGDPIKAFGDSEKSVYIQAQSYSGNQYDLPQFTWSVSCDKEWCHYEYSGGSSLLTLRFTCDDNTTGNNRTAILTVNAGEQSLKIGVEQLGTPSVTVSTPGTLTQELANKDLLYATSLKISGELSDKDLETIKGLREVETLDLTEAIIDDLPDEMFCMNETIKQIKLPETIKVIHPRTFAFSSLEYIYFPASIETIEDGKSYTNEYSWAYYGAFANTNLATIEFAPNSKLKYIGERTFAGTGRYEHWEHSTYQDQYTFEVILPKSVETIADYAFCFNTRGTHEAGNYENRLPDVDVYFETGSNLKSFGKTFLLYSISIDATNSTMVEKVGNLDAEYVSVAIGTQIPPASSGVDSGASSYLYVPKGCVGAYYDADGWKEFETIKEIGQE